MLFLLTEDGFFMQRKKKYSFKYFRKDNFTGSNSVWLVQWLLRSTSSKAVYILNNQPCIYTNKKNTNSEMSLNHNNYKRNFTCNFIDAIQCPPLHIGPVEVLVEHCEPEDVQYIAVV